MQDDGNSVVTTRTVGDAAVTPFLQKSPSPERINYRRERRRGRSLKQTATVRTSHESVQSAATRYALTALDVIPASNSHKGTRKQTTSLTEEDAEQIFSLMDSISSIEDHDLDRKSVSFQLSAKPEGRRRGKRSRRFRRSKRY